MPLNVAAQLEVQALCACRLHACARSVWVCTCMLHACTITPARMTNFQLKLEALWCKRFMPVLFLVNMLQFKGESGVTVQ